MAALVLGMLGGSFFPIAPLYGRARITGLARINGDAPIAIGPGL